jgi:hypothetical protein
MIVKCVNLIKTYVIVVMVYKVFIHMEITARKVVLFNIVLCVHHQRHVILVKMVIYLILLQLHVLFQIKIIH